MSDRVNHMDFTPEEVAAGRLGDWVNFLLKDNEKCYNIKGCDSFNEIHITTDGYCTIVEWIPQVFNYTIDGFKYVGEEYEVVHMYGEDCDEDTIE